MNPLIQSVRQEGFAKDWDEFWSRPVLVQENGTYNEEDFSYAILGSVVTGTNQTPVTNAMLVALALEDLVGINDGVATYPIRP